MQKIKLNTVTYHNGKYLIYLDRETKVYFTNKRKAQDFLTQQGQRTDKALLFISETLTTLTDFFRLYNLADYDYKFKFEVKNSIDFISDRISYVTERCGGDNRQALVMQAINGCYRELVTAFTAIRDKAIERNDALLRRRCELRIEIVNLYSVQLYNVGEVVTSEVRLKVV